MGMNALRRRYSRASGYLQPHHRYAIYGLVPKRGGHVGEHLKKRHLVGRARDAYEAAAELYRLRAEQRASGSYGQGRWTYIVVDRHAGRGKLAPVVTYEELLARAK